MVLLVGSFSLDFLSEFSAREEQALKVFLCHHGVSRDLPAILVSITAVSVLYTVAFIEETPGLSE